MNIKTIAMAMCFCIAIPAILSAQNVTENDDAKKQHYLIKLKRMSLEWQDRSVVLENIFEESFTGRFHGLKNQNFLLVTDGKEINIDALSIKSVMVKRKKSDLIYVFLSAAGSAALVGGMSSLGMDLEKKMTVSFALLSGVVGFKVGLRAFYFDTVYPLTPNY